MLCTNLEGLHPIEVRTATQIGIDTGRRPDGGPNLPLDCLHRDKDGAAVLVYDNAKADRLARRLPISEATAVVITSRRPGSEATTGHPARRTEAAARATPEPGRHPADEHRDAR